MFQTDIRVMEEAAMEMQQYVRKWNKAISDAEMVAEGLRHLSGMEEASRRMQKQIMEMETRRRQMFGMMTGLKQMAECYGICERNIIDYAEGAHIHRRKSFEWFQVRLPDTITEKLKQIIC